MLDAATAVAIVLLVAVVLLITLPLLFETVLSLIAGTWNPNIRRNATVHAIGAKVDL